MIRHHHPRLLPTNAVRHRRQGGYVMVTTALLLIPLLLMAGLSVDVGNWYSNTSNIQKAADAAALAGVVWLPDTASAITFAEAAAKRNGYEDGVNNVTVKVERVGDRRLRVTIKDSQVGSFFYQNLGGNKISLTRTGTAEYVLPVPLGSPDNRFGNDLSLPAAQRPNLWGNIHGVKTDSQKGDAFAPACDGGDHCTIGSGTKENASYRSGGYLYTIDVANSTTGFDLQIYDAGLAPRSAETVDTGDTNYTSGNGTTRTVWTFYKADSTDLVVDDNPIATSTSCPTSPAGNRRWDIAENASDTTYKNKWVSLCKNDGTMTPGRYLLRVQTTGTGSAANRYAIRVLSTSTAKPRIAGFGDMSMYNNIATSTGTDVSAKFYLAEVDQIHRGKTFRISMYDPGEVTKVTNTTGKGTVKVIVPGNTVATSCTGTTDSTASTFTSGATLAPCQFDSAVNGSAKYNGSWVTLDIKIPATYTCTMNTIPGCWWKIEYVINGQANDTTTWAAQVIGDPVHLVQE